MSRPWPPDWRLTAYDELPSTQDAALQAARAGAPGRLAITARHQTHGRGSRGRTWLAPSGNLNFSALLRPLPCSGGKTHPHGTWPLLAGLALYDAIAPSLPMPEKLMLKWPNDLLLDGAKLAGILIDSALAAGGTLDWVVVGIGVNVTAAPEIERRQTACLHTAGAKATSETLAPILAHTLDRWMDADFEDVCATWLSRAHPVGTKLTIRTQAQTVEGAFAGLAPNGGLLLAGHPTQFNVGELHIAQPQPALCFSS